MAEIKSAKSITGLPSDRNRGYAASQKTAPAVFYEVKNVNMGPSRQGLSGSLEEIKKQVSRTSFGTPDPSTVRIATIQGKVINSDDELLGYANLAQQSKKGLYVPLYTNAPLRAYWTYERKPNLPQTEQKHLPNQVTVTIGNWFDAKHKPAIAGHVLVNITRDMTDVDLLREVGNRLGVTYSKMMLHIGKGNYIGDNTLNYKRFPPRNFLDYWALSDFKDPVYVEVETRTIQLISSLTHDSIFYLLDETVGSLKRKIRALSQDHPAEVSLLIKGAEALKNDSAPIFAILDAQRRPTAFTNATFRKDGEII